ncbi:MAG: hypothetical protein JWM20_667 [Patescibacteria group bacterium]|nr:hypothetical protein [Patescibacteria group bacterium]
MTNCNQKPSLLPTILLIAFILLMAVAASAQNVTINVDSAKTKDINAFTKSMAKMTAVLAGTSNPDSIQTNCETVTLYKGNAKAEVSMKMYADIVKLKNQNSQPISQSPYQNLYISPQKLKDQERQARVGQILNAMYHTSVAAFGYY